MEPFYWVSIWSHPFHFGYFPFLILGFHEVRNFSLPCSSSEINLSSGRLMFLGIFHSDKKFVFGNFVGISGDEIS